MARSQAIIESYEEGWKNEAYVKEWLRGLGHTVEDSTKDEDIRDDIDCYVDGHSVSIKCNDPEYTEHPFLFELEGYSHAQSAWLKRWYYTGKAEFYVVWKRHESSPGRLWVIEKARVKKYVEKYGFDKLTGIKDDVKELQKGHDQRDTRLGLINQRNATRYKLATLISDRRVTKR